MRRLVLALSALVAVGGSARAQIAGPASPVPAPNPYSRQTQPLSPYLNLLRGGNPGVNYYYGVRPGTTGGAATFGAAGLAPGGSRPTSFPIQFTADDALVMPEPGEGYILPPAGHPTAFNNTMGYFPGPSAGGQRPRPGIGGGGGAQARPGARR